MDASVDMDEDKPSSNFWKMAKYALCALIQCESKEKFIRDMLSMDISLQRPLMAIIETHLQQIR